MKLRKFLRQLRKQKFDKCLSEMWKDSTKIKEKKK